MFEQFQQRIGQPDDHVSDDDVGWGGALHTERHYGGRHEVQQLRSGEFGRQLRLFGFVGLGDVNVGSSSNSYAAVIVLKAQGSTWTVADRGNACQNHLVPTAIYTQACTTS